MSRFDQVLDDRPVATVIVPPSVWASEYLQRPRAPVVIGIRALSETEVQVARVNAVEYASKLYRGLVDGAETADVFVDAYQDALLRWAVGLAACHPDSTDRPYFERGDDDVREKLTSQGALFLWEAIEREQIAVSPSTPALLDTDVPELARRIGNPAAIDLLEPATARRVRKLLGYVLGELRTLDDLL